MMTRAAMTYRDKTMMMVAMYARKSNNPGDVAAMTSANNSGSKKENNAPTSNTNDNNSKMPIPEDTLKSNLQQIVEDVHPKKLEEVVHNNPTPTALHAAGM